MKIEIDTENKTIEIIGEQTLGEVVDFMKSHFEDWEDWSIIKNSDVTFSQLSQWSPPPYWESPLPSIDCFGNIDSAITAGMVFQKEWDNK